MASGISSSKSAPHFASRWSAPIKILVGKENTFRPKEDNTREYYVPENILHMHTAWFKEHMHSDTLLSTRQIRLEKCTAPAFDTYLYWVWNGTLPEVTSVTLTESEHFDVKEDSETPPPSAKEQARIRDKAEWDAMSPDTQQAYESIQPQPPTLLHDWLDAYMLGETLRVDEFMDTVMRKMCELVWTNKKKMRTINDDEAYKAFKEGAFRLKQFVISAVFLNMEFWRELKGHDLSANEAFFLCHDGFDSGHNFRYAYQNMWERNKNGETRIQRWMRLRDQSKVPELFIKGAAAST